MSFLSLPANSLVDLHICTRADFLRLRECGVAKEGDIYYVIGYTKTKVICKETGLPIYVDEMFVFDGKQWLKLEDLYGEDE